MAKITAQYQDVLVQGEQGENGLVAASVKLSKGKKPANSDAAFSKIVEAALQGKVDWKILDMSWATPFQQKVYREMVKIKPGTVLTYAQLAKKIGSPRAYRAVASACARNRLPLVIPCHRVIRTDGGLGGYSAGDGIKMKKYLLGLEGYKFTGDSKKAA